MGSPRETCSGTVGPHAQHTDMYISTNAHFPIAVPCPMTNAAHVTEKIPGTSSQPVLHGELALLLPDVPWAVELLAAWPLTTAQLSSTMWLVHKGKLIFTFPFFSLLVDQCSLCTSGMPNSCTQL